MVHLLSYCYTIGLYHVIQDQRLQTASLRFCVTVAFHLILMMAYDKAETLNKIMYSISVAMLFAT